MSTHFQTANGQHVPLDPEHPPEEAARERRERQRNYPPLLKYLNKTCDAVANLDKQERVRVREAQVKAVAYYDGRQDGEVRDGVWHDNEYINGEIRPEDNQYKIQVDKLNMEMCRAPFEFEVEATDPSDSDAEEAAKFFKHRLDVNRERTETEAFKQAENLSLLTKSATFRHVYFDPNEAGDAPERLPKFVPKDGQTMRVTVCRTCGMPQGVGSRDEQLDTPDVVEKAAVRAPCEVCGDSAVKELNVQTSGGMDISYEEVPGGRVVTVRPDAIAVQLDMQARDIRSSRFLRWVLTLRRCDWQAMFPGKKIPKAKERKSDEGRWAQELAGHASNDTWDAISYDSPAEYDITGGEQFEKIEGELIWLDRVVYADYVNRKAERTPSGELAPGWNFDEYPNGCCIARIGTTILDLYPSDKNECWSMCVYGLREHALHGAGTFAMLGPCNTINDLNAYIQANNYYNAAPREFIKSGVFSGDQLPAINKVGVATMQFDENQRIVGHAYDKSPATSLAPDVYAFRENQRGSLQEHAGTSSLSLQGAADMKALGTATGVEASRDQAVGRMIPNLKLQMDMIVEWMYQVGQLERANCSPEMFLRGAGQGKEKGEVKYTERGVRAFFERDPRRDFRIRPAKGSWMPTTPQQEKANATEFGVLASQLQQNPEVLATLAPKYGVDYKVNEWGATERAAALRLREWARIADVITRGGFPPTPEMADVVLQQAPAWAQINPTMDNHEAFMNYLRDWWTSDEGTAASPLLRMVVEKAHLIHGAGGVVQGQLQTLAGMAAQAPAQAVQEEQAATQQEEAARMKAAELQMGAEEKQAERQAQVEDEEARREHELTLAVAKSAQPESR